MKKKIMDLETLTEGELLNELVERLCVEHESRLRMDDFLRERGWSEEDASEVGGEDWAELVMENDEDWCRVREILRFVKKDDALWEC